MIEFEFSRLGNLGGRHPELKCPVERKTEASDPRDLAQTAGRIWSNSVFVVAETFSVMAKGGVLGQVGRASK